MKNDAVRLRRASGVSLDGLPRARIRGVRPTFTGGVRLNSGGVIRDPVCIQVNTISCVDIPPHKYLCTNWSNTFGAVHNARVLRG